MTCYALRPGRILTAFVGISNIRTNDGSSSELLGTQLVKVQQKQPSSSYGNKQFITTFHWAWYLPHKCRSFKIQFNNILDMHVGLHVPTCFFSFVAWLHFIVLFSVTNVCLYFGNSSSVYTPKIIFRFFFTTARTPVTIDLFQKCKFDISDFLCWWCSLVAVRDVVIK